MAQTKVTNFRIPPAEMEGLKVLSELTGTTQTEVIRNLIRAEMVKQHEAIDAYKKSLKAAQNKLKE